MMDINWLAIAVAALVPTFLGGLWYGPLLFEKAWMKASGVTEDMMKSGNMFLIMGLSVVLSFLLAFTLQYSVIHQFHLFSMVANEPGFMDPTTPVGMDVAGFMEKYGSNFRTFKHGALHGGIVGLLLVGPILTIIALFERKNVRYILLNVAYWLIALTIMGGIICAWQ
ncbi:MAG: DUF1761 domain-containing protein [Lewinella sp.]|nr:DUF1761 domain-containing protein [Lewinella sp.]